MCVAGNAVTETMGPIVKDEGSVLIDDPQLLPLTTSSARREIRRLPAWDDFLSAPQVIQYKKKKRRSGSYSNGRREAPSLSSVGTCIRE